MTRLRSLVRRMVSRRPVAALVLVVCELGVLAIVLAAVCGR